MRRLNADLIQVAASAGLPALANFLAAALALHVLDPVLVGRSYALLAVFYVAIDAFNFGSARIYTIERIRARFVSLLPLDCVSAVCSAVFFFVACMLLERTGSIALPNELLLLVLAPACYGMSHFALGFFRVTGRNSVVLAISTVSAVSRLAIVWALAELHAFRGWFPDLLLLVEAAYGAMLLAAYLILRRRGAASRERMLHPKTGKGGLFWYRSFIAQARGELLSSWYANALLSGAKHVDVLIVSAVAGPAGAAMYRVAKGVNNLAFNFGQSLSLAISGNAGDVWRTIDCAGFRRRFAVALSSSVVGLAVVSFLLLEIGLFPVRSLGSTLHQFTFVFAVLLGACLVFLCRVLSLWLYAHSRRAFVQMSSCEVVLTLGLVSGLGWKFGAYGAVCGIGVAALVILASSCLLLARHVMRAAPAPADAERDVA
ncbi:hypothetical protein DPR02_00135 [Burkholderia cepacia]|uniref:Polysaccharide biosynthesis protein n=1 Tax=Burkholderia cepacia TaxID=292 RepID=A0AAQ0FGT2_BURCE|nr:hypothetical protein [Burkholderia cepacia]RAQ16200.1 hypothetical protein DPR02_00135 [Burkholderia cepacia]